MRPLQPSFEGRTGTTHGAVEPPRRSGSHRRGRIPCDPVFFATRPFRPSGNGPHGMSDIYVRPTDENPIGAGGNPDHRIVRRHSGGIAVSVVGVAYHATRISNGHGPHTMRPLRDHCALLQVRHIMRPAQSGFRRRRLQSRPCDAIPENVSTTRPRSPT